MRSRTLERVAGATAVASMLATPFTPAQSRRRVALTWLTVTAGATRTWAIERRCRGTATATGAACGVLGGTLIAEAWGTRTGRLFGVYAYTDRLRPRLIGVPVLVPLAWYAVALPARTVADRALGARSTPAMRVGLGAIAMTAWDLFLDPQMTAEDSWRWPHGGRYRGIPLHNFAGWLVVAVGLLGTVETTGAASDDDSHLVTYATIGVLETVAFSTFWRDPFVAVAGGVGMLPLTLRAIVARTGADRSNRLSDGDGRS